MKISVKGRYALAAMTYMALNYKEDEYITVVSISEKLGISKIYLEQVFSLLKRGKLLNSIKGAQGGYQLARMQREITVFDILFAVELSLFEKTEKTLSDQEPEIEKAMRIAVFDIVDDSIQSILKSITLNDLVTEAQKHKPDGGFMFYI